MKDIVINSDLHNQLLINNCSRSCDFQRDKLFRITQDNLFARSPAPEADIYILSTLRKQKI